MANKEDTVKIISDRTQLPEHFQAVLAIVEANLSREDLRSTKESFERLKGMRHLGVLGQFCIDSIDKILDEKPIELTEIVSLGYLLLDIKLRTTEIEEVLKNDSDNQRSTRTH